MRILALDPGEKRIGVAASDPLGLVAHAVGVVEQTSPARVESEIRAIVEDREVERVVVGLPLNMDGSRGPRAKEAERFASRLRAALPVPVETFDERLTTVQAEAAMIRGGLGRGKRRARVDRIAAQILLQAYLDRERSRKDDARS